MKKIFTIAAALLMTASVWAQAPEKMSYQAVVRDAGNTLVTSQAVGMQISILQGSASGTSVYTETQNSTTNTNGLVSLEIGAGTVVSGDFTTVDWANDTYFIKTETDPTGGTTYTITGTTQLMSVPYALHAKTAESVTGTVNYTETDPVYTAWDKSTGISITESQISDLTHTVDTDTQLDAAGVTALGFVAGPHTVEVDGSITNELQTISRTGTTVTLSNSGGTFTDSVNTYTAGTNITISASNVINATGGSLHYVGELFGGGIVFYVYNNGANGLIASLDDLDGGSGVAWSAVQAVTVPNGALNMTNGSTNTAAIVAQDATAGYAATLCSSYSGGSFTDWYLPSNRELYLLASHDVLIDQILDNDGIPATNGFSQEYLAPTFGRYWSSTEYLSLYACYYAFSSGFSNYTKNYTYRVRAVRAF